MADVEPKKNEESREGGVVGSRMPVTPESVLEEMKNRFAALESEVEELRSAEAKRVEEEERKKALRTTLNPLFGDGGRSAAERPIAPPSAPRTSEVRTGTTRESTPPPPPASARPETRAVTGQIDVMTPPGLVLTPGEDSGRRPRDPFAVEESADGSVPRRFSLREESVSWWKRIKGKTIEQVKMNVRGDGEIDRDGGTEERVREVSFSIDRKSYEEYLELRKDKDWEISLRQGYMPEKFQNNKYWWRDYVNKEVEGYEKQMRVYGENEKWSDVMRVYVRGLSEKGASGNLIPSKVFEEMPDFEEMVFVEDGKEVVISWKELLRRNLEGRRKLHNRWVEWESFRNQGDPLAYTKMLSEGSNLEPEDLTYGIGYLMGENLVPGRLGDQVTKAFSVWNQMAISDRGLRINGKEIPNIFADVKRSYNPDVARVKATVTEYLMTAEGATKKEAEDAVNLSWRLASVWGVRDYGDAKQPNQYKIPKKRGLAKYKGFVFSSKEVVAGSGTQSGPLASVMYPREYMATMLRKSETDPSKEFKAGPKLYWVHPEKLPKTFLLPFTRTYSSTKWVDKEGKVRNERRLLDKLLRNQEFGGEGLTLRQIPWARLEGADQAVIDRHYELMTVFGVNLWNAFFSSNITEKVSPGNIRNMVNLFNKVGTYELFLAI